MPKVPRTIGKNIPKNAKKILEDKKIRFQNPIYDKKRKKKYTKERCLLVYSGYDCFENLIVVRTYICKKYDVTLDLLEILLYLTPKNFFTLDDYFEMPKQFTYNRIGYLIKRKFISIVSKGNDKTEHVYRVSHTARNIVEKFYEHLCGELPISENPRNNSMAKPSASSFDKIKMNLIKKINAIPVSETKKGLFE